MVEQIFVQSAAAGSEIEGGPRSAELTPSGPPLSWEQFGVKLPTDPARRKLLDEALQRLNGLEPAARDRFVELLRQFDGGIKFNVATASTKAIGNLGTVFSPTNRAGQFLPTGRRLSLQLSRQTTEWDDWVKRHNIEHRRLKGDTAAYRQGINDWTTANPEPLRWRLATADELADVMVHELGHANDFQQVFDVGTTISSRLPSDLRTKVHEMYWGGPRGSVNPLNAAYEYATTSATEMVAELQRFYLRGIHSHGLDLTAQAWRFANPELARWVEENLLP